MTATGKFDRELKYDDIRLVKLLENKNPRFHSDAAKVFEAARDVLNTQVPKIFPHFTLHDINHSIRIMEYMYDILNEDQLEGLNELEIILLIYSALLHDIGMAVSQEDQSLIILDEYPHAEFKFSALLEKWNGNETLAMQDFVRRIHAKRSALYIRNTIKELMYLPGNKALNLAEEVALICESHTQDYSWIKRNLKDYSMKGEYKFNQQYCAFLLRLGDILDFDSQRTPPRLYDMIAPQGQSKDEWRQHFVVHNEKKVTGRDEIGLKKVEFHGRSEDASIHRKVLKYIDWINYELQKSVSLSTEWPHQYRIMLKYPVVQHIETVGYTISDFKLKMDFNAVTSLLMGEKIYGDKTLGLRELVQNAMDACRVRKEIEDHKKKFGDEEYNPTVKVILDQAENKVIIKDNGIGMSRHVLENYFLNIGVSYYKSDDYQLKGYNYKPIGNFGIGFLACYMLSDTVKVITRDHEGQKKFEIGLEKGSDYILFKEEEGGTFYGTEVILNYEQFMEVMENYTSTAEFLKRYFLTHQVSIVLVNRSAKTSIEIKNQLGDYSNDDKSNAIIDISKYCVNTQGTITIKKDGDFIKKLSDLDLVGRSYFFNGESVIEIDDSFNIDEIISEEHKIIYGKIPLIKDEKIEKKFKLLARRSDIETAIEDLESKLTWITLFIPPSQHSQAYTKDQEDDIVYLGDLYWNGSSNTEIIEGLNWKFLNTLGHREHTPTTMSFEATAIVKMPNALYIPFSTLQSLTRYHYRLKKRTGNFFLRSVLLPGFTGTIPYLCDLLFLDSFRVNIDDVLVSPDVSRNHLDERSEEEVNYAFGKAIHQGALDLLLLSYEEKEALQDFIHYFYPKKSILEK